MRKLYSKACCFILSLILCLSGFGSIGAIFSENVFTLTPYLSDGITIDEIDMSVSAVSSEGVITFLQTKQLIFRCYYSEGWSFNRTYSTFFPNNSNRVSIVTNEDSSVTFTFNAVEGESVLEEDFNSVCVNATAQELPKLDVTTQIPIEDVGKSEWVEASFTLTMGTKQFESGDYEGDGFIKGRGNSSWLQDKKPYSLKLSEKKSLLDIPKTKKYAIVPSFYDSSLMKNYITYKTGLMLNGIEYTPKCEFIEVYFNGEYHGIYLLVERIAIEKTKIDIEEADENDITGGYLIEKDCAAKLNFSEDQWFNCPYWANQSRDYFVIKSPEPEDSSLLHDMKQYLEQHMQKLHDSIMGTSDESYTQYVDVDSWIDFIIIQELSKNIDGNLKTSCYMIKQSMDDKIYMTALWDFDLAYGVYGGSNASEEHNDYYDCPLGYTVEGFMTINSSCPWFQKLYYDYPEFRSQLIKRYNEYRTTLIPAMQRLIKEQAAYLRANTDRENELWGKNFTSGVNRLSTWLESRIEWLDEQWGYKLGDVNYDGEITVADAVLTLRAALGAIELDEIQATLADMNKDGKITAADANLVARTALGFTEVQ